MKTFLLFLSTMCFGQQPVILNTPLQYPDHPQHADMHAMSPEQSLLNNPSISVASGERPLWEVYRPLVDTSLGVFAKAYREAHAVQPKAKVCYTNQ